MTANGDLHNIMTIKSKKIALYDKKDLQKTLYACNLQVRLKVRPAFDPVGK